MSIRQTRQQNQCDPLVEVKGIKNASKFYGSNK